MPPRASAQAAAQPVDRTPEQGWVVASSCPRCGAPLDFTEGSNAVRCTHCASMLLVTGRRRVLSYVVRPRVVAAEAAKVAAFARPSVGGAAHGAVARRVAAARLVFVPYYRLCAEEVFWRRERVARPSRPVDVEPGDLGEQLVRIVSGRVRAREQEYALGLASRVIERSFLALDTGGLASWSLGVRSGVLRLELFARGAVEAQGLVLRPTLDAGAALARLLEPLAEIESVHREVLRALLSLVYFPLWTVASGSGAAARVTVLDGVTGSIVARDADPAPLSGDGMDAPAPVDRVLGFRPLCCPNCGWDLPVRPADVVFHCTSCERTWELRGEELEQIPSDVVAHVGSQPRARARSGGETNVAPPYLPVWQVTGDVRVASAASASGGALPPRLVAPAFRWRAPKALCDLGARLTHAAHRPAAEIELEPVKNMPLVGCSLDRTDALTMARLVALRMLMDDANVRDTAARGKEPRIELGRTEMRLLWLPFAGDAYSVRDPLTGYALARRAVQDVVG